MKHVFVDFEMTCWRRPKEVTRPFPEIIEIGAARLDDAFQLADQFSLFIQPEYNPQLTKVCTELTGIRTEDLEGAPSFAEAIQQFQAWLEPGPVKLYAWGKDDRRQLEAEYRAKGLGDRLPPSLRRWSNFQSIFMRLFDFKRRIGLTVAMEMLGIDFEGPQHRAVNDAINSARLLTLVKDPEAYPRHKERMTQIYNRKDAFGAAIGDLLAFKLSGLKGAYPEPPE
jgi:inhibitor of KinA sporulation pathway (predicted exonuclease)